MRIPSGSTSTYLYFVAVDATDRVTRETGLSAFTVVRSRNGAADAAYTTPTIAEIDASAMPGVYALLVDEDTTIASGSDEEEMVLHITCSGMAPITRSVTLYRRAVTSGRTLGVESDGDLTKVNTLDGHTAQTGDCYARLGAPAGASVSADVAAIKSDTAAILVDTGTTLQTDLTSVLSLLTDEDYGLSGLHADLEAIKGAGFLTATDSLEALRNRGDAAWIGLDAAGTRAAVGMAAANLDTQLGALFTTVIPESYGADGAALTPAQCLYLLLAHVGEFAITGTTKQLKRLDGSTNAAAYTLDDDTNPTAIGRTA